MDPCRKIRPADVTCLPPHRRASTESHPPDAVLSIDHGALDSYLRFPHQAWASGGGEAADPFDHGVQHGFKRNFVTAGLIHDQTTLHGRE